MKKKLLGLFLVVAMLFALGFAVSVKAEGEEETPVTYTCSVVINSSIEHGDVIVSSDEGNVGDVVTISVEPHMFYLVEAVYANGTQILTNEDGLYQFALVEGENTVNAKFVINSEALETIVELVEKGKNEGFETLFQPKNLIILITAFISLIGVSGLLVAVSKLKKAVPHADELAAQEVKNIVPKTIEDYFKPILDGLYNAALETKEISKTMARCMVLMQENTPEARLAIIDELTKVQNSNEEIANQVVTAINTAIEKAKELQNEKIKALNELEQANNNLLKENAENEPNNDNEGRY